jgi:hypothetical protein
MSTAPRAAVLATAILLQVPIGATAHAATPRTSTGVKCTIVGTSKADTLKGTSKKDVICGLGGNDRITGAGGDDIIDGGTGNDTVYAGPGNDTLIGSAGSDTLHGDSGTDTVTYADRTKAVTASLDGKRNDGQSGEKDLIGPSVENLTGGSGNDSLTGSTGRNVLRGGPGNDLLRGGAGADTLDGGSGSDLCDIPSPNTPLPPVAGAADKAVSCSADSTKPFLRQAGMYHPPVTPLERKQVTATARVTDNFSGVSVVGLEVVGPNEDAVFGEIATLTTGDEFDGTWRAEFTIPADAPVGSYELHVRAIDRAGNLLEKASGAKLDHTGGIALPEAEDEAAPTVTTWDVDASWAKDGSGPADVVATAHVTDEASGVASVILKLVGPGGETFGGSATLTDGGTAAAGTWRLAFRIPSEYAAGVYRLVVEATDVAGNTVTKETGTTLDLGAR